MIALLRRLRLDLSWPVGEERGASMVEFGLLVALVAVVVAVAATTLGQGLAGTFDHVANRFDRCARFADKDVPDAAADKVGGWKCQ